VWNEPNLALFLNPQYDSKGRLYSPRLYRDLVNAVADAVHHVSAENVVVAGETAPYGGTNDRTRMPPLTFMRSLLCLSKRLTSNCTAKTHFDVWSTHPYTWGPPTTEAYSSNDVAMGDLPEMQSVLRAGIRVHHVVSSTPSVPFWVTEISWDTRGPDWKAVPLSLHARWTAEALYRMSRAGVSRVYWWMLRDQPFPASRFQSGFYFCGAPGLFDESICGLAGSPGDAPKSRSLQSFRFPFVAFASNGRITVWGRVPPDVAASLVTIQRQTSSGWKDVTTVTVGGNGIFQKLWSSSSTSGYLRATLPAPSEASERFSLTRPASHRYPPFGCGDNLPC